jgi:hypothetical protein
MRGALRSPVPGTPAARCRELSLPLRQDRDEVNRRPEGISDRRPAVERKRRAQLAAYLGDEHRNGPGRRRRVELREAAKRLCVGRHRHADRELLGGLT